MIGMVDHTEELTQLRAALKRAIEVARHHARIRRREASRAGFHSVVILITAELDELTLYEELITVQVEDRTGDHTVIPTTPAEFNTVAALVDDEETKR
jgi:hypothetical protein